MVYSSDKTTIISLVIFPIKVREQKIQLTWRSRITSIISFDFFRIFCLHFSTNDKHQINRQIAISSSSWSDLRKTFEIAFVPTCEQI